MASSPPFAVALLIIVIGWVVAMAGVADLQAKCNPQNFAAATINIGIEPLAALGGRSGDIGVAAVTNLPIGTPTGCPYYYRWFWWSWSFEAFAALGMSIAALWYTASHAKFGWLGILAASTVLQMMCADSSLSLVDAFPSISVKSAAQTAVAGFCITAAGNLLAMMFLPHEKPANGGPAAEPKPGV